MRHLETRYKAKIDELKLALKEASRTQQVTKEVTTKVEKGNHQVEIAALRKQIAEEKRRCQQEIVRIKKESAEEKAAYRRSVEQAKAEAAAQVKKMVGFLKKVEGALQTHSRTSAGDKGIDYDYLGLVRDVRGKLDSKAYET